VWRDESGAGPVSTVFGIAIFLGFLLLATQTLIHLYASSTVSTAVFDAASRGAAEGGGGCPAAIARARTLLGDYGERPEVQLSCDSTGDSLRLTLRGPTPANLIGGFGATVGSRGIERTATVRFERFLG
jgi:hypothetical protein